MKNKNENVSGQMEAVVCFFLIIIFFTSPRYVREDFITRKEN